MNYLLIFWNTIKQSCYLHHLCRNSWRKWHTKLQFSVETLHCYFSTFVSCLGNCIMKYQLFYVIQTFINFIVDIMNITYYSLRYIHISQFTRKCVDVFYTTCFLQNSKRNGGQKLLTSEFDSRTQKSTRSVMCEQNSIIFAAQKIHASVYQTTERARTFSSGLYVCGKN